MLQKVFANLMDQEDKSAASNSSVPVALLTSADVLTVKI